MIKRLLLAFISSVGALSVVANARTLVVHNNTNFVSDVKVNGHYSGFPTGPHRTQVLNWQKVKIICRKIAGTCLADVYLKKNPEDQFLGNVTVNLKTGNIISSAANVMVNYPNPTETDVTIN